MISCFAQEFYMYSNLFYRLKSCYLAFRLGDVIYFSRIFIWLLRCTEPTVSKSSLLFESFNKFTYKCKFPVLITRALPTYWLEKNAFFVFYKRDAATYRLLNCLGETSKMSYKKHFSDKLYKLIDSIEITFNFYFLRKSRHNCQGVDVFSDIFEFLLLLYI